MKSFNTTHIAKGFICVSTDGHAFLTDKDFENPVFLSDREDVSLFVDCEQAKVFMPDDCGGGMIEKCFVILNRKCENPYELSDFRIVENGSKPCMTIC